MKSKYKVSYYGFAHGVTKNGKFVCSCNTKHQAYKIKSALEQFEAIQECVDCKNFKTSNCGPCKFTTRIMSHFQPKEKK